jgi:rhomboid family GlyGly-CTERM serine protease
LTAVLVYDRQAVLAGELWRLWTGHLVHFSSGHLFYNLLVMAVAGCLLERGSSPRFGFFCFTAAGLIGAALLAFKPQLRIFGGLSGLAVGAVLYLAVQGIRQGGGRLTLSWMLFFLSAAKLLAEALQGEAIFAASASQSFVPVFLAHWVGALTGVLFGIRCTKFDPSGKSCNLQPS